MKVHMHVPAFRWNRGELVPEPIMHIPAVVKRDDAFNNGGQTQVGKNAAKSAEELEAEAARRKQREADRKDREAKRANAKRCFCLPRA